MNLLPFVASGVGLGGVYAMSSVGLVILYRASGTLNFAFGAFACLSAFLAWQLVQDAVPAPIAWLVGIAAATAISFCYGRFVAPRMAHRDRVVRAIATLGVALVILGSTAWFWGVGVSRRLPLPTDYSFIRLFGVRITATHLLALAVSLVMVGGIGLLLRYTRIGLGMRVLASNRQVSALIGVKVVSTDSIAWLIHGLFAGIAGLLLADLVRLDQGYLTFLVIPAIASAILGRLSSLPGAFAGGLFAGLLEAILTGVPDLSGFRSAGPYVAALLFMTIVGAGRGVGASE
jgi:branched-chain amino acid transport system permease protein